MEKRVLNILKENARVSNQEISDRLNISVAEVEEIIKSLEDQKIICGYTCIIDESAIDNNRKVQAVIEVKVTPQRDGGFDKVAKRIAMFDEVNELALVSGSCDLIVTLEGETLQEIATFVSGKLSTIDGVLSTTTSFQLKKYKQAGRVIAFEDGYDRLKVCP